MKRILITGTNSYIGTSLERWLKKYPNKYEVKLVSLRDGSWKEEDFSAYDVVFHVAAIVHNKEKSEMKELYHKINTDLTIELANKSKESGIKHFIFMSSMSVYGIEGKIGKEVIIKENTPCYPQTYYGKSKLQAEQQLSNLEDEKFIISIIRAPMIYGPNCMGNYIKLRKLAVRVPIFPATNNRRSMLYIDNLSECIRLIIDNQDSGLFFPQNKEYVNTSQLVKLIAKENLKGIYLSNVLRFIISFFCKKINIFGKVFGNLVYDFNLSNYRNFEYCIFEFDESVSLSEQKNRANNLNEDEEYI